MTAMEPMAVPLPARIDDRSDPTADIAEVVDVRQRYAEVFDEHQHRLLRLAYLLTGNAHRAEEAVAEAFAKVWPHWQRGRVTDVRAYLTRVLVNEVNSAGRRLILADKLARSSWLTNANANAEASARKGAPDDATAVTDHLAVVAALAKLPPRQRAVVVLRYYDDLTEAATAQLLGMRIGTVKSQTSRALTRLRTLLQEDERQPR